MADFNKDFLLNSKNVVEFLEINPPFVDEVIKKFKESKTNQEMDYFIN